LDVITEPNEVGERSTTPSFLKTNKLLYHHKKGVGGNYIFSIPIKDEQFMSTADKPFLEWKYRYVVPPEHYSGTGYV
jgi:hypothetical protein